MPQAKGRKKGRNRDRRERITATSGQADEGLTDDDAEARRVQQSSVQAAQQPMPSSMARSSSKRRLAGPVKLMFSGSKPPRAPRTDSAIDEISSRSVSRQISRSTATLGFDLTAYRIPKRPPKRVRSFCTRCRISSAK